MSENETYQTVDLAAGFVPKGAATLVAEGTRRPPQDPMLGTMLDEYLLDRVIGKGGMGTVYEGWHKTLQQRCAIKLMNPSLIASALDKTEKTPEETNTAIASLVGRFVQEAISAAAVPHDHVVSVYNVKKRPDGTYYIVMEYLEGSDLMGLLRSRAIYDHRLIPLVFQATWAFHEMHLRGIVHRDIKPSNLFVVNGPRGDVLKILDFGVAKMSAADRATNVHTSARTVMGTWSYMAPEQAQTPDSVDGRADIYALAAVMYECLTGYRPFIGETELATFEAKRSPPRPLWDYRQDLPDALDLVIRRALSWNADDRYCNMREFAEDLARAWPDGEAILAAQWPATRRLTPNVPMLSPGVGRLTKPVTAQHPVQLVTGSSPSHSIARGQVAAASVTSATGQHLRRRRFLSLTGIALGVGAAATLAIGFTAHSVTGSPTTSLQPAARPTMTPAPVVVEVAPAAAPVPAPAPAAPTAVPAVVVKTADPVEDAQEEARIDKMIDEQEARERRRKRRQEKRDEKRKSTPSVVRPADTSFDPDGVL